VGVVGVAHAAVVVVQPHTTVGLPSPVWLLLLLLLFLGVSWL
jgi:hypothetical protein